MVEKVVARASHQPAGTWIVGSGWNENYWDGMRMPTHHALSAALPDHPVFLVRIDSHSALVNLAALTLAGISRHTPDPYGGEIRRMPDGSLSGMLIERAVEPVLEAMPVPPDAVVREATLLAAQSLASRGYTEICDAGIMHFPGLVAMNSPMERWLGILRDVDETEGLPVAVNIMVAAPSRVAEGVLNGSIGRQISPRVRYTHLKLYADGAFGSRGALLSESYSDDAGNIGISRMTEQEMFEQAARALGVGLDVAVHAIGDAAVERVLNVYERLLNGDRTLAPRRLRLEHFSVASAADIRRAAQLGILIVAQPGFVWPMPDGRCMEDFRLGSERVQRAYVWRTLLDLGAEIAGSSDDYGLPPHPLWNFFAAATRKNPQQVPRGGWQPQERISRKESMCLLARWAEPGGEWRSGILDENVSADLVIMSANPLAIDESEILGIQIHATFRDGALTWGQI
jgi:predicted amidohydrolase YtcJ